MLKTAGCRLARALAPRAGGSFHPSATLRLLSSSGTADSDNSTTQKLAQAGDLSSVLRIVESEGESFGHESVLSALTQVERHARSMAPEELQQLHSSKTVQMLCDMAVSSAGSALPGVLASTIGVLGRLRLGDELVLDSLARHLMPSVKELGAEQLAEMVDGLRRADHSPSVLLLDEIHERLAAAKGVAEGEARSIEQGLHALGRDEGNPPNTPPPAGGVGGAEQQPDRIKYS